MTEPSTTTLGYSPDAVVSRVIEPLRTLAPCGRRELMTARRKGRDCNALAADYWRRYDVAWLEMERLIFEEADRLGVPRGQIWQHVMELDTLGELLESSAPPSRWGFFIPRVLETIDWTPAPPTPVIRPRSTSKRRSRAARTATPSRGDPDDGEPHQEDPWALTAVDRGRFLWRLRALRCRLLEIREGVRR